MNVFFFVILRVGFFGNVLLFDDVGRSYLLLTAWSCRMPRFFASLPFVIVPFSRFKRINHLALRIVCSHGFNTLQIDSRVDLIRRRLQAHTQQFWLIFHIFLIKSFVNVYLFASIHQKNLISILIEALIQLAIEEIFYRTVWFDSECW